MKTIVPITVDEVALLLREEKGILSLMPRIELPARIVQRITINQETGCWLLSGWSSGNGFAKISIKGRSRQLHRVIYTLLKGPIPDGLVLDHAKERGCRHRNCGNPEHLRPVTVQVNTLLGNARLFQPKEYQT